MWFNIYIENRHAVNFFCWYIELHTLSFSDIIFLFHRVTLWTEAITAWKHLPGYWLWRPSKMFLSILTWNWANVYIVLWESKHEVEKSPSHQKQTNLSFIIFLLLHLMTSCLLLLNNDQRNIIQGWKVSNNQKHF